MIRTPNNLCIVCESEVRYVIRCQKCSSGLYCSKECVEKNKDEHVKICSSIQILEKIEKNKKIREFKNFEIRNELPLKTNRDIIRLVGERPLIEVFLDDVKCKCLWDTGSMISLISKNFLIENFPNKKIYSVDEFLENELLSLSAANNTEVPVEGVILIEFSIESKKFFQIPFLVTSENVANPIIGYNAIEYLVMNFENRLPSLLKILPSLSVENAEIMVSTIEKVARRSEILGDVKLSSSQLIPGNCLVHVPCKTRVQLGTNEKDVLISPIPEYLGESDLVVYELITKLKRGKSQVLTIAIFNPTSTEQFLKKNTVLGNVINVNTIIQFPLFEQNTKVDCVNLHENKIGESWLNEIDLSHLSDEEVNCVKKMLTAENDVFSKEKNDIGFIPDFKMPIHLIDNIPVSEPYRQIPKMLYNDVKSHINNLLALGWIKKSTSSYASPMVCARKKDGSLRLCCDYRNLNKKTIPDKQPIPRVQDILDGLGGQKYFSTLDMSQAYHQGEINLESQKFTAFSTPWSLYEWVRIPYGLTNAPPCFQRFMNDCLYNFRDKICVAYLDDILIYGKTWKEHEENLKTVLRCLRKKGVKLNPKKCEFFKKEIRYLGRLISGVGYRPDPENTAALNVSRRAPKTVGNLRSLLGFIGYYRNFVKDFSRKLKPVYDLLKIEEGQSVKKHLDSKREIKWLPEHQFIVDKVIDSLQSPEVIAFPDFKEPFILHCDASQNGLGGVLYQNQSGKLRVISFASRTLTPAEKNYFLHSGKLEFLALKWCITDKFSDYLHYGPPFEVFTDNNPLTYVLSSAKLNATGLRWVSQLANYKFEIKYRPGKKHIDADFLSRHPLSDFKHRINGDNNILKSDDINLIFSEASRKEKIYANIDSLIAEENIFKSTHDHISSTELAAAQRNDDIIAPVYAAVLRGIRKLPFEINEKPSRATQLLMKQFHKLSIENEVLVRKTVSHNQLVLPKSFHHIVFNELHNKMGHLGSEKVVELTRKRFYWPYLQKDIEFYIRKKCRCIVAKKPNIPDRAPLVSVNVTSPFEMVSIDFLHLDRCKGGYEYVLMVCDHFTRFVQIFPTKNKSAKTAADNIFNKFILNYGFPRRIHHDQGGEFNNKLFARLHELSGIAKSRTTPYHPMGDGQCERMNRTLINMLKCLNEAEKKNWKDHVAKLAFAYNSTVNKATSFSPFYLMFGRESRLPIDSLFGIDMSTKHGGNYNEFANNWEKSMKQAFEIARKHIEVGKKANVRYYNKKVRGNEILIGDEVLLRNNKQRGGTGKLNTYWENTVYQVVNVDPLLPVFTIRKQDGKSKRVHRNNILKCNDLMSDPNEVTRITVPKSSSQSRNKQKSRYIHNTKDYSSSDNDMVVIHRSFKEEVEVDDKDEDKDEVEVEVDDKDEDRDEVEVDDKDDEAEEVEYSREAQIEAGTSEDEMSTTDVEEDFHHVNSSEVGNVDIEETSADESNSEEKETSDSDSTEEEIENRRSVRNRRPPKKFTYNVVGGDPVYDFR